YSFGMPNDRPARVAASLARLLAVLSATGACRAATAAPTPPAPPDALARVMKLEVWARGLSEPVGMAFATGDPGQRIFIVEKTGKVRIAREGRVEPAPFLDVADRVSNDSEQGLLGLAMHPHFADNGKLVVNYTDLKGDTNVVEFRVSKDDPD